MWMYMHVKVITNKLKQHGWKGPVVSFYFSSFYSTCYHLSWLQLLTGQVWAAPLQNQLAASELWLSHSLPASQVGIWPSKNHLGTQHSFGVRTWCYHLIFRPKMYSSHHSALWRYSVCLSGPSFDKEKKKVSPTVRDSQFRNLVNVYLWNPESGKILLVKESGIQLKESGIPLTKKAKFHWLSNHGCLGFPHMERKVLKWSYLLLLYFATLNFREFCTDFKYNAQWKKTWKISFSSQSFIFIFKSIDL